MNVLLCRNLKGNLHYHQNEITMLLYINVDYCINCSNCQSTFARRWLNQVLFSFVRQLVSQYCNMSLINFLFPWLLICKVISAKSIDLNIYKNKPIAQFNFQRLHWQSIAINLIQLTLDTTSTDIFYLHHFNSKVIICNGYRQITEVVDCAACIFITQTL